MSADAFLLFLVTLLVGWGVGFITGMHVPWSLRNEQRRRHERS